MTTTTTELVSYEDPSAIADRVAVPGFVAGYTGNTPATRPICASLSTGATAVDWRCWRYAGCIWMCSPAG